MALEVVWTKEAEKDFDFFRNTDIVIARKIKKLVESVLSTPFKGIGKPEPLQFSLAGYWSRRITLEHRLVYGVKGNVVTIISCRFHYRR